MSADSYLTLAQEVLEASRSPLSAREIIQRAYVMNLVPRHLHGKTQHKTITARISEDILRNKDASLFFRPYPGRYFLSKFLNDDSLPEEYRRPIIARRRSRQLNKEYAAYLPAGYPVVADDRGCFSPAEFARIVRRNDIAYDREGRPSEHGIPIWHFSYVRREREILTYRRGRFLDGREDVANGKTVGFSAPLTHNDRTLFEQNHHGVLGAAVSVVSIDLNLEHSSAFQELEERSKFRGGFVANWAGRRTIVLICHIQIPKDFAVETSRLAIKDLAWTDLEEFRRRLSDYDLWSKLAAFQIR